MKDTLFKTDNKKLVTLAGAALALASIGAFTVINTGIVKADAEGMSSLPKGVQITKGVEMPGQFAYHPKIIPGITQVHAFGAGVSFNSCKDPDSTDQFVVFDTDSPAAIAAKGKLGVYYENTGVYNGHQIDTKMTVLDWHIANGGSNTKGKPGTQHRVGLGTNFFGLDEPGGYPASVVRIRVDNIDHVTGEPIKIKGYYSFMDIDGGQAVGFDDQTMQNISSIYYTPDTHMTYRKSTTGENLIEGTIGVTKDYNSGGVSIAYNDTSSLTFDWYSTGYGEDEPEDGKVVNGKVIESKLLPQKDLDAANQFGGELSSNYDPNAGKTVAQVAGSVAMPSFHGSWIEYGAQANLPHTPEPPYKFVSDSDEGTNTVSEIGLSGKSVDHNTLKNRYETYHYQVTHYVPDEKSDFYYQTYEITDDLDKVLDTKNVHVYNSENQDVTYRFTVTDKDNKLSVVAKPSSLTQRDFYNETYKVTFDATVKPGVSLADHKDSEHPDQALIKNKPMVKVNNTSVDGNTVKTNIPFTKEETPKKMVSIDGKGTGTTLDGLDFNKPYIYDVDFQVPDNVNVSSFSINDKIDPVQAITDPKTDLQVLDLDDKSTSADGKDISSQGKFSLDKKTGAVSWTPTDATKWHGKHLRLIIKTHLLDTPDLLKYLDKDTGKIEVPNTAHFKFNDKDDPSNTTKVSPKENKGSVDKMIEVNPDDTGTQKPGIEGNTSAKTTKKASSNLSSSPKNK